MLRACVVAVDSKRNGAPGYEAGARPVFYDGDLIRRDRVGLMAAHRVCQQGSGKEERMADARAYQLA